MMPEAVPQPMPDDDAFAPGPPVVVRRIRASRSARPQRLLFLHGLASGGYVWDSVAPLILDEAELWSAELPWRGVGVVGWALAEADAAVADALERVPGGADVVVAHSFAANALLRLIAHPVREGLRRPRLPRALVFAAPFFRASRADFDWNVISYYLNNFHHILAQGVRIRSGGRMAADIEADVALRVREHVGPHGWMRFFGTYLETPELQLDRVSMPSVVIGGAHDFAAFPTDAHALAAALPAARCHILPDCGHFAMVEAAAVFAGLVNKLLVETRSVTAHHEEVLP